MCVSNFIFVRSHMRKLRTPFGVTTIAIVIENNNEWQLHRINTSFYIWTHNRQSTYLCKAKPFHPCYTYIHAHKSMHVHTRDIEFNDIALNAGKQRRHLYVATMCVCVLALPKLSKIAHLSDPEASIKKNNFSSIFRVHGLLFETYVC